MRPSILFVISKIQYGGGRYFEKSAYFGRSFRDFNEIWLGNAIRPSLPFGPLLQILKFKDTQMAAADILKVKITISWQPFDRSAQHLAQ